jgi:hypothetical protein
VSSPLRRTREVIRKFDPNQRFWHSASVIVHDDGSGTLITYWRNPELAGIWEYRYHILPKCLRELFAQALIEHDESDDPRSFMLSAQGLKRLG